jgi:hypothetical protein
MKFKVGDKIKMIKSFYGDDYGPVKIGDILTIRRKKFFIKDYLYGFHEIEGNEWMNIEECFINLSDREEKLKRICDEEKELS